MPQLVVARLKTIWREAEIVCPSYVWFQRMVGVQAVALSSISHAPGTKKKLRVVPDDWTLPFFILE